MAREEVNPNEGRVHYFLEQAGKTAGATESGLWRSAVLNVGGAIAYALLDLADAVRSSAKRESDSKKI
jgi:hypothetical protein